MCDDGDKSVNDDDLRVSEMGMIYFMVEWLLCMWGCLNELFVEML